MMPRVRLVSRCRSAGARRTNVFFRLIFFHSASSESISRRKCSSVTPSATVRTMTPPAPPVGPPPLRRAAAVPPPPPPSSPAPPARLALALRFLGRRRLGGFHRLALDLFLGLLDRVFVFVGFEQVGRVEESAFLLADVDECRLDSRQHRFDSAEIDIADRSTVIRPVDEELGQAVVFEDSHAGLPLASV